MSKFSVGGMEASGMGSLLSSGNVKATVGCCFEDAYARRLCRRRSYLCLGCGLAEFGARRIERTGGEGSTRA
jgi:hypothetical protein